MEKNKTTTFGDWDYCPKCRNFFQEECKLCGNTGKIPMLPSERKILRFNFKILTIIAMLSMAGGILLFRFPSGQSEGIPRKAFLITSFLIVAYIYQDRRYKGMMVNFRVYYILTAVISACISLLIPPNRVVLIILMDIYLACLTVAAFIVSFQVTSDLWNTGKMTR